MEKLSPQPQVREAFGLLNTNPFPFKPPENSKMVPAKYKNDFFSTAIFTLLSSKTLSFSPIPLSNFKTPILLFIGKIHAHLYSHDIILLYR